MLRFGMLLLSLAPAAAAASAPVFRTETITIFSNVEDWRFERGAPADGGAVDGPAGESGVRLIVNPGQSWWAAEYAFLLPPDARNILFEIGYVAADDRAVLSLNRVRPGVSMGIGAPGKGRFQPVWRGPHVDFTFSHANGPVAIRITEAALFNSGRNALRIVINNTNEGLTGNSVPLGPSSFAFGGQLRYETATVLVPEPATWAMMLAGFAMAGVAIRRRSATA